ncbi:MAG TPA: hypothetical protein VNI77_00380 [Nitrososphaera sp.]|nr:hypothetical protein [Nitrososphaera sp.]
MMTSELGLKLARPGLLVDGEGNDQGSVVSGLRFATGTILRYL